MDDEDGFEVTFGVVFLGNGGVFKVAEVLFLGIDFVAVQLRTEVTIFGWFINLLAETVSFGNAGVGSSSSKGSGALGRTGELDRKI